MIYFGWNPTVCNIFRRTSWFLIFWWQLHIWIQFMHIAGFCLQKNTRRNCWISPPLLIFITKRNHWYLFFCRGLVFHYECYHGFPLLPYHNDFCKEFFLLFYRADTVDVCYNIQLDNAMYLSVHDNHWQNLMLHDNSYYVMV